MDELKKTLQNIIDKGFFHLLSANFLIQFITFGSGLIVAGLLTPVELGNIRIIQTYIGLWVILAGLGINTSTLKIVSENRSIKEKNIYLSTGIIFVFVASIIVMFISIAASYFGLISTDKNILKFYPCFAVVIPFLTLNSVFMVYLQGKKEIKKMSYIQSITKLISVILILLLTYLLLFKGYTVAYTMGIVITSVTFALFLYKPFIQGKKHIVNSHFFLKKIQYHWVYAKFALLSNGIGYLNISLDLFLLNYLIVNRSEIGQYSFAATLIVAFRILTSTVQQITAPYFSEKMNNIQEWNRVLKKYNKLNLYLTIAALFLGWFVVPWLIHLLFMGKYDESVPFFRMLLLVWAIKNSYMLYGIGLYGLGKLNYNYYIALCSFIINLILCYIFILKWGTIGGVYGFIPASVMGLFAYRIIIGRIIKRQIKI